MRLNVLYDDLSNYLQTTWFTNHLVDTRIAKLTWEYEAEEGRLCWTGAHGEDDDICPRREYSPDRLPGEDSSHVGGGKLSRHAENSPLQQRGVH